MANMQMCFTTVANINGCGEKKHIHSQMSIFETKTKWILLIDLNVSKGPIF